jgi:hypothetical protein
MLMQVLGSGCRKCNDLYDNVSAAAARFSEGGHTVEKVDDVDVFFRLGVRVTPALVVDGDVVSSGRVLTVDEVAALIEERQTDGS